MGESCFVEKKGRLEVSNEDKLLEIKILNCYSNLELTLDTNIYKDGIVVGKVYKIELDSEGDVLYFLEPEYRLTQPDDTFKEYFEKVKDVEYYIKLEEEVIKLKDKKIESLEEDCYERLQKVRDLNDKLQDYSNEIKLKNKELESLPNTIKSIRNNIIDEIKVIMENTTILERLSMNRFISKLNDLKKY